MLENSLFTGEIENYFTDLKSVIEKLDKQEINLFLQILLNAYHAEKQVFVMGNGGSASTASHFACDINKGTISDKEKRFKVICLNDNVPSIMAYANDMSYDEIFVEQLKNFLNEGDVVIGISGSGNSKNILRAIQYANSKNAITLGLAGYPDSRLKEISKHSVNANINDIQYAEDIHTVLMHLAMKALCRFI